MLRSRGQSGRADGVALALAAAALAIGGAAQWGTRYGWLSAAGFGLAALLFGLSARRTPDPPALDAADPPQLPGRVLALIAVGAVLCGAAAVLVYRFNPPLVTHLTWAAGLLAFVIAAALAPRGEHRLEPLTTAQRAALLGVCAFSVLTLAWGIGSLPTEVHGDDAEVGLDALRLIAQFNLFGAGWFELPRFHAFPTAVGLSLVGFDLVGLRASSAALGVAGVLLVFAVGRRLWSVEVGLLAALLLAGQRFYIHISRAGYHYIDTPVLSLLALWLFLRLWQERRLAAAVCCGIALGLGIQTYYASRLVPGLIALTWLICAFSHLKRSSFPPLKKGGQGGFSDAPAPGEQNVREHSPRPEAVSLKIPPAPLFQRGDAALFQRGDAALSQSGGYLHALRRNLPAFLVIVIVAIAVAAPMFGYFAHDWDAFWERTRDTSMFTPRARQHLAHGYGTDHLAAILAIQLRAALTLFNHSGDNSVQYGMNAPLFDPVSGVLFVLGVGLALAGWRQARLRIALLWIALPLVAGAALTIDTPFYPRISGLVPFAVLLVALALDHLWRLLRAAVPGRLAGWAAAALLAAAAILPLAINARTYFVDYAPRYRHSPSVEIAAFVRRHGTDKTTYMIGGAPAFFIRHGAIAFLTYGYKTRDIERVEQFLNSEKPDPRRSVFVVMPQGVDLVPRLEEAVGPVDLQTHRSARGEVAFYTAVPRVAGDGLDPPALLTQSHLPGTALTRLGVALDWLERLAIGALLGAAALLLGLALHAAWRRPRPPGVRALREPLRERLRRWRTRLAGPDVHERTAAPPRWATWVVLALILALALGLRTYRLTELPAGFFCDEAGNGFNSFCLLHAGRDETGARWPLYVWSFSVSYKNPIFLYSTVPAMALLGPTELAVRLTAALYGTATVLALFFLGRALLGSATGLAAALLLAVLPWHLHFSRIGFELIALPFYFTLALTCLVRWTQGRRTLGAAAVLLGLCLYTYVPAKLFVPLFGLGFALLYRRALLARWRESLVAGALLALTVAPVAIFDLTHGEQAGSYFANTTILASEDSPLGVARRFVENYGEFFSREFLFEASNDRIIRHSVSDHGELYWCLAPLLALGIGFALLRRDRALLLPLLWLALYPAAAALMNEIPSASRGFIGAPAFALVAAIGVGGVLRLAARPVAHGGAAWVLPLALVVGGLAVLAPAVERYWALYRDEYPLYSAKYYTGFQYGHRQVLDVFHKYEADYDLLLLTTRKSNQPEVFLRFYDGTRRPRRDDPDGPPFEHGEKYVASSAEAYDHFIPGRQMLFAVLPEEVPLYADARVVERVIAPDGTAAFVVVAVSKLKDFISTWMVGGPYPEGDQSPPPLWALDAQPPFVDSGKGWRLQHQLFAGVPLNDLFAPNMEHTCAWALNAVTSEVERELRVFAGFDDTGEVWVNGVRIDLTPSTDPEQTLVDNQSGTLRLLPGRNTIAVRSCDDIGDWKFYFRLANLDGSPVEGLSWTYGPRRLPE